MSDYSYVVKSGDVWADALVKMKDGKALTVAVIKQNGQDVKRNLVISKYPDYLRDGKWKVQLAVAMDEIKSAKPLEGVLKCAFVDFAHEKDQPPIPKIEKKYFKAEDGDVAPFYTIVTKVVDGDYEGATVTVKVQYDYFVPVQTVWKDKPVTVVGIKLPKGDQSSKHALNSLAFVDSLELLEVPAPWSDNILPVLSKRAKKATADGKLMTIIVENGYAKKIQRPSKLEAALENDDFFADFDEDVSTTPALGFETAETATPVSEPDPFEDADVDTQNDKEDDDSLGEWEDWSE